ncbi:MAG: alpha/beta fold hydrolase [Chloroflexota bacterium]
MRKAIFFLLLALLASCGDDSAAAPTRESVSIQDVPVSTIDAKVDPVQRSLSMLAQFEAGDFESVVAQFDQTMKDALSVDQLQKTWIDLNQQTGEFVEILNTRELSQEPYSVVIVTCQFETMIIDVQTAYNEVGEISGLYFRPGADPNVSQDSAAYVNQDAFEEESVTIGAESEYPLPGTLTLPLDAGPFPAVVLVHGSGPLDMDSTIGPNKPFRDLAWGLASQGIAVLRYDKRTWVYAEQIQEQMNTLTVDDETILDVHIALTLLRERPDIDHQQLYVIGHSLGGMLAPRIAEEDPLLAGIVLLAGNSRPIEDLMLEQSGYLLSFEADPSEEVLKLLEDLEAQVELVKSNELNVDTPPDQLPMGVPAAYWLGLREYSPAQTAAELTIPILLLHGERDYQVTAADMQLWEESLTGKDQVTFISYPSLNHLFMSGEGPSLPKEYMELGHVDAAVVSDIANWILSH